MSEEREKRVPGLIVSQDGQKTLSRDIHTLILTFVDPCDIKRARLVAKYYCSSGIDFPKLIRVQCLLIFEDAARKATNWGIMDKILKTDAIHFRERLYDPKLTSNLWLISEVSLFLRAVVSKMRYETERPDKQALTADMNNTAWDLTCLFQF
jgi:hypothetical protein